MRPRKNVIEIQLSNTTQRFLEQEAQRTNSSIQAVMRKILQEAKEAASNEPNRY
ncbi:hypothetical protein ACSTIN_12860 [Vibrio parahaemolyticus]